MKYNFTISRNNIQVKDVPSISKKEYNALLDEIHTAVSQPDVDCIVLLFRSNLSLKLELAAHALLYNLHIARERTRDCDLNYPQAWYIRAGYAVCGAIGLIFNK